MQPCVVHTSGCNRAWHTTLDLKSTHWDKIANGYHRMVKQSKNKFRFVCIQQKHENMNLTVAVLLISCINKEPCVTLITTFPDTHDESPKIIINDQGHFIAANRHLLCLNTPRIKNPTIYFKQILTIHRSKIKTHRHWLPTRGHLTREKGVVAGHRRDGATAKISTNNHSTTTTTAQKPALTHSIQVENRERTSENATYRDEPRTNTDCVKRQSVEQNAVNIANLCRTPINSREVWLLMWNTGLEWLGINN